MVTSAKSKSSVVRGLLSISDRALPSISKACSIENEEDSFDDHSKFNERVYNVIL